jgi:hypothetical protein
VSSVPNLLPCGLPALTYVETSPRRMCSHFPSIPVLTNLTKIDRLLVRFLCEVAHTREKIFAECKRRQPVARKWGSPI